MTRVAAGVMVAVLLAGSVHAGDLEDGVAASRRGDHLEAIASYSRLLDSGQLSGESLAYVYHNRGSSRRALGQLDLAVADYGAALELMPEFSFSRYGRGVAQLQQGAFDAAIADLDAVIAKDPEATYAIYARAQAYRGKGDLARAVEDYSTVIRHQPNYAPAYFDRANARNALGRRQEALADYRAAHRLDPGDPRIRARLVELGLIRPPPPMAP